MLGYLSYHFLSLAFFYVYRHMQFSPYSNVKLLRTNTICIDIVSHQSHSDLMQILLFFPYESKTNLLVYAWLCIL